MLVKIPEGTWCKFYDQTGTNTHIIKTQTYGLIVDKTPNERNQIMYTVLIGSELFEVPKEEVSYCQKIT